MQCFEQMRWGDKPVCMKCGCDRKITKQTNYKRGYWCGVCREYFTAFTNTPLEHSRVRDVRKWIFAAYLLMTTRKGISGLQLSKELAVTRTTAWYMLHRLRLACGGHMEAFYGKIEADEVYFSREEENERSKKKLRNDRSNVDKQTVIGIRKRRSATIAVSASGTTLYTDDNPAYNGACHNWSKKRCAQYVNEFTFRLNEGKCPKDTKDRLDDLLKVMSGKTITCEGLTA